MALKGKCPGHLMASTQQHVSGSNTSQPRCYYCYIGCYTGITQTIPCNPPGAESLGTVERSRSILGS